MMTLVDTNIPLRWLFNDHPTLSREAGEIVAHAEPGELLVSDVVVGEIIYIIRAKDRSRSKVIDALLLMQRTAAFRFENDELMTAMMRVYATTNLDFVDCYLLARSRREKVGLQTFDNQLQKMWTENTRANKGVASDESIAETLPNFHAKNKKHHK